MIEIISIAGSNLQEEWKPFVLVKRKDSEEPEKFLLTYQEYEQLPDEYKAPGTPLESWERFLAEHFRVYFTAESVSPRALKAYAEHFRNAPDKEKLASFIEAAFETDQFTLKDLVTFLNYYAITDDKKRAISYIEKAVMNVRLYADDFELIIYPYYNRLLINEDFVLYILVNFLLQFGRREYEILLKELKLPFAYFERPVNIVIRNGKAYIGDASIKMDARVFFTAFENEIYRNAFEILTVFNKNFNNASRKSDLYDLVKPGLIRLLRDYIEGKITKMPVE